MSAVGSVFERQEYNQQRLAALESCADPRRRYVIAMTPRSGSSYLCSVLEGSRLLGFPGEFLNQEFIPKILNSIPGRTPSEYFRNLSRAKQTKNGVFGVKASWFQFDKFMSQLDVDGCFGGYRYVFLTRRNLAAQAVSLYKATSSNIFHTNIQHDVSAVRKLEALEYDFDKIYHWYRHIVAQEKGWQNYFLYHRISPCYVTYEEVDEDVSSVVKRIAFHVGVNPEKVRLSAQPSVFTKVSDFRNVEWSCRFMIDLYKMGTGSTAS